MSSIFIFKSNLKSQDNGNCKSMKVICLSMFHLVAGKRWVNLILRFCHNACDLLVKCGSNIFGFKVQKKNVICWISKQGMSVLLIIHAVFLRPLAHPTNSISKN